MAMGKSHGRLNFDPGNMNKIFYKGPVVRSPFSLNGG